MMDAIHDYKERRRARLDAKAVEKFRERRADRVSRRFDDESNDNNEGKGGGHGNTRIPFGLCQREGISIGKDWGPQEAWDALAGKGYNAGDVYRTLKETGKATGPKKPVTKVTAEHFPSFMRTKALNKSVSAIAKFVSEKCDDGNVTELISAATGSGVKAPPSVKCKRSGRDGTASVTTRFNTATKEPVSAEIVIPMFSDKTNEADKEQKIRDFCHEWTHYLDMVGREGKEFGHFSTSVASLRDAVLKDDGSIGEEPSKIFAEFKEKSDALNRERGLKIVNFPKELAKELYGETLPAWIKPTGYVDSWIAYRLGKQMEAHEYNLKLKKRQRDIFNEYSERKRRMMNGVSNLQGIYNAIHAGAEKEKRGLVYGHREGYFKRDATNRVVEALADYVALKATNPKLASVFAKDKPKVAAELDKTIALLGKKLRGTK